MRLRRAALLLTSLLFFCGCGKKGPLVPPGALVPPAAASLRAEQKGLSVRLSWIVPPEAAAGLSFKVLRREATASDLCDDCPSVWRPVAAAGGEPSPSGRFSLFDTDAAVGKTYRYRVVPVGRDGVEGPLSASTPVSMVPPPPAPVIAAEPTAAGVKLSFYGVRPPRHATVAGVVVYRWAKGERPAETPLTSRTTAESFMDITARPGIVYCYAVRSIALVDNQRIESDLSNIVESSPLEP